MAQQQMNRDEEKRVREAREAVAKNGVKGARRKLGDSSELKQAAAERQRAGQKHRQRLRAEAGSRQATPRERMAQEQRKEAAQNRQVRERAQSQSQGRGM